MEDLFKNKTLFFIIVSNIILLKKAGFKTIEPFFQSLNFKGYICIK